MILCCGEALDMIPALTDSGNEGFIHHSGGAIFNTAIALGRLNVPVVMLTGLSNDLVWPAASKGIGSVARRYNSYCSQ